MPYPDGSTQPRHVLFHPPSKALALFKLARPVRIACLAFYMLYLRRLLGRSLHYIHIHVRLCIVMPDLRLLGADAWAGWAACHRRTIDELAGGRESRRPDPCWSDVGKVVCTPLAGCAGERTVAS